MEVVTAVAVLVGVAASFTVSASAGLGGSLLMVPTLVLVLGSKEGVALSALLLAGNNIAKLVAYRRTLPYRAAVGIVALIIIGAAFGSTLLVRAPEWLVTVAVVAMFAVSVVAERRDVIAIRRPFAPLLALASGAASGFSGTSGPLKGVAIRNLDLDRRHFVGAASLASFAGDLTKTAVFADAQLLGRSSIVLAVAAVPLMAAGTWIGSTLNERAGERTFAALFWTVMAGYTVRLGLFIL